MDIILADTDTTWEITSAVETPPVVVYRHVVNLEFSTGGYADSINVDPESSSLAGAFTPQGYDALDNAGPIQASKGNGPGGTVIVSFDAPRRIKKIEMDAIANADAPVSELTMELYRMDGESIADQATYTVSNNEEIVDFISAKFAIKAFDDSQAHVSIETNHLLAVIVQSNPTGPRMGIAPPAQAGENNEIVEYFWNVPGEITDPADTVPADKNPAEELAKALIRYLNDQFNTVFRQAKENEQPPSIPGTIGIDLVFESDAPCNFDATRFTISYSLIRQRSSFPYQGVLPKEKTIARFSGNALKTEEVIIQLPKNAEVLSARLKTEASIGGEPSYVVGNALEPLTSSLRTGISITADRWIAQPVTPDKAVSINGLALGIMNLAKETELLVQLQEDWNGQPSGRKLAEARIHSTILGERTWIRISLRDSIPLATQPCWILLKSAQKTALWFTRTGDFEPVQVLQAAQEKAPLTKITAIKGVEAYYAFFSASTHGREHQAPFELSMDTTAIPAATMENDTISFELKDPLNNKLSQEHGGALAGIPFHLSSPFPGMVTIYPPRIEYTLMEL
ncbi:MAG: hypothetical protein GY737_11370 [Desulfobacteraceae bacterium]|nr:hypothetical protein [Desulfobacteraceae bacterium]